MKNMQWILLTLMMGFVHTVSAQTTEEKIRAALAERLPQLPIDTIAKSPLPGLYEVTFGARVVYVDETAHYLVNGDMLDLQAGISVTKQRTNGLKAAKLQSLDEKDMIIYGNKDAKHTVTVFTDIECGYCRKLHSEIDQYIKEGIRIRYLAYPRAGIGSEAAKAAESVWCADDPAKAMTIAKQGGEVEPKTCDNPVAEHYALGQQFAINGTPALVLQNGEVIPGYVPAKRLGFALKQHDVAGN